MADQLYLSIWYPNFRVETLPMALVGVLRQFALIARADLAPDSENRPRSRENSSHPKLGRVLAASSYPINWTESPTYQRIYDADDRARHADQEDRDKEDRSPRTGDTETPKIESAVAEATNPLHDDMAYEFEMCWMLWTPPEAPATGSRTVAAWRLEPVRVKIIGFGPEFDAASYEQNGHIRVDFGPDIPWIQENGALDRDGAERIRQNVEKLLAFTLSVEKHCGISSRLLWTESGEPLAEKLVARLQRLN
ncbi:MAG: hypothetical protein ACP5E5_12375 [Acidobacteriaceae bacterium]